MFGIFWVYLYFFNEGGSISGYNNCNVSLILIVFLTAMTPRHPPDHPRSIRKITQNYLPINLNGISSAARAAAARKIKKNGNFENFGIRLGCFGGCPGSLLSNIRRFSKRKHES